MTRLQPKFSPLPVPCVLSLLLSAAYGFSNGFGNGNLWNACDSLTPGHQGMTPRTTTPPYQISFSPTTYTPGSNAQIAVTISACSGQVGFKGFMLQAREADNSSSTPATRYGSFDTPSGTRVACADSRSVVHDSSAEKTSLTFNWSPGSTSGHIIFKVTFAESYATVWVDVASQTLQDSNLAFNPSNVLPATSTCSSDTTQDPSQPVNTPQPSASVQKNSGCGSTVGCFASCADDSGASCTFAISWRQDGNNAIYTLSAGRPTSGGYIALGFSEDSEMDGEHVIGCVADTTNVVKVTSTNSDSSSTPYLDNDVSLTSGTFADGVLTCEITLPLSATTQRKDLTQLWTLLFVMGSGSTGGSGNLPMISYHGDNRFVSSAQVSASSTTDLTAKDVDYPLIKAHGSLMIFAWVFAASIGTIAARYFKPVWTTPLCDQKVWFQIHRTCMILVFLATAVGFILIFVEVEEWSDLEESKSFLDGHPIMGVIVMALTVLNPLMAFFRPHPGTKNRPIFNVLHFLVGTGAHILAVITIFFGVELTKAQCPDYLKYILAGYCGWQFFIEVLLSIIGCACTRRERKDAYEMTADGAAAKPAEEVDEAAGIKKVIFSFHVMALIAFAAVVIAFVIRGD